MTPEELGALRDSWILALRAERKSPNTVISYRNGVNSFLAWCAKTDTEPELTPRVLRAFTADMIDSGVEGATARVRSWAVRRLSYWAAAEGEIDTDQLIGLKLPSIDEKVIVPLTDAELVAILATCSDKSFVNRRDEAIIRLLIETTARAEELIDMCVSDTKVQDGVTLIRRGKGGKGRLVSFSPIAARAIDRYLRLRRTHRLADTDELWLGDRGTTFRYPGLYRVLRKRGIAAGIERHVHPHLFRHIAATRWLAAGGSEDGLLAMAGWKSRQMLHRYVQATSSARAIEESRRLNLGDLG